MMDRLSGGETPDLILLDLELPGLSGVQALRKIRAVCPDLPVLVLTAHAEESPRGIYGEDLGEILLRGQPLPLRVFRLC
jgi:CheY-like chemotaxis protein